MIEAGDTEQLVWTASDRKAMRKWTSKFLHWWLTSPLGSNARYNPDNIGFSERAHAVTMIISNILSCCMVQLHPHSDLLWR